MMSRIRYKQRQPAFPKPGRFRGWFSGSIDKGRSAAACRVHADDGSPAFEDGWPSEAESTIYRAILAGARGCLEAIPDDSITDLYTSNEAVYRQLSTVEELEAKNWKGVAASADLLKMYLDEQQARRLTVRVHYVEDRASDDRQIIDRLAKTAKVSLKVDA